MYQNIHFLKIHIDIFNVLFVNAEVLVLLILITGKTVPNLMLTTNIRRIIRPFILDENYTISNGQKNGDNAFFQFKVKYFLN